MSPRLQAALTGIVLLLTLALRPADARGQEVFAFWLGGSSGSDAFESVTGFGAGAGLTLGDHIRLRAGIDTRDHTFSRIGISCINPAVNIGCQEDRITMDNRFSSFSIIAVPFWAPVEVVELGAGAGLLIGRSSSEVTPESGLIPKVFLKNTANVGFLGLVEARFRPVPDAPVFVDTRLQLRRISLEGCANDEEALEPFCGTDGWTELNLGIGFTF